LSHVRKWSGENILQVREKSGNFYLESGKIYILKQGKFNLTQLIFYHKSQGNVAAM